MLYTCPYPWLKVTTNCEPQVRAGVYIKRIDIEVIQFLPSEVTRTQGGSGSVCIFATISQREFYWVVSSVLYSVFSILPLFRFVDYFVLQEVIMGHYFKDSLIFKNFKMRLLVYCAWIRQERLVAHAFLLWRECSFLVPKYASRSFASLLSPHLSFPDHIVVSTVL
jgi:hypothetical protein